MKLIFTDLDDTLLVERRVPDINKAAIARAMERGNIVIPCSGRPPFMMGEIQEEISIKDRPGTYSVCLNGGLVVENKGNRVLYSRSFTEEETLLPMTLAGESGLCAMVFTPTDLHMFEPDPAEIERKKRQRIPVILHDGYDLSILDGQPISKIMIMSAKGQKFLETKAAKFPKEAFERLEVTYSSDRFMEMNPKGTSKGNAIRFLAEYLGVPIEDTIAIGDNFNDISMLKAAGTAVCVANAVPEVKALCDYVCQKTCEEGGVAEALEKLL